MRRKLLIWDLGRREYGQILQLQTALVNSHAKIKAERLNPSVGLGNQTLRSLKDVATNELEMEEEVFDQKTWETVAGKDVLLLVEHEPPVYTMGKRDREADFLLDPHRIREQGTQIFKTRRGGAVTWHGPGQLVGYPVVDLRRFGRSVRWFVSSLQQVLIQTLSHFGIPAHTSPTHVGVWTGSRSSSTPLPDLSSAIPHPVHEQSSSEDILQNPMTSSSDADKRERKLAAIGLTVSHWITMHGFALNVCNDLRPYDLILPCGIDDKDLGVSTMARELHRPITVDEVKPVLLHAFSQAFDVDMLPVHSQ
jgi:lipoyl(octanoyl) transferase